MICVVFAITGSSTTWFVRPIVENLLLLEGLLLFVVCAYLGVLVCLDSNIVL